MKAMTPRTGTFDLARGQLMVVDGGRGQRMRVLCGAAWLTQEGEPDDAVLRSGAEFALHEGRSLIQALEPARVQILRDADADGGWIVQRRFARLLQRWTRRLQFGPALPELAA